MQAESGQTLQALEACGAPSVLSVQGLQPPRREGAAVLAAFPQNWPGRPKAPNLPPVPGPLALAQSPPPTPRSPEACRPDPLARRGSTFGADRPNQPHLLWRPQVLGSGPGGNGLTSVSGPGALRADGSAVAAPTPASRSPPPYPACRSPFSPRSMDRRSSRPKSPRWTMGFVWRPKISLASSVRSEVSAVSVALWARVRNLCPERGRVVRSWHRGGGLSSSF